MAVDTDDTEDQTSDQLDQQDESADHDTDQQQAGDKPAGGTDDTEGSDDETSQASEATDEVVVTIGDEAPPASVEDDNPTDPALVRTLRKEVRERNARIRELEQAQAGQAAAQQQAEAVKKPTLEECDYDEAEYERRFLAYQEQERTAAARRAEQEAEQRAQQEAWEARVAEHQKAKTALKVPDYDDAEDVVKSLFSPTQQGILLHGAENSALLAYAIGKNPAKAKELASITDPVKFAFAVAKLETKVKATPRKAPPPPEKTMRGSAPGSASVDSQLARLEADAERTGDRSKVVAFKRQQMQRQAG